MKNMKIVKMIADVIREEHKAEELYRKYHGLLAMIPDDTPILVKGRKLEKRFPNEFKVANDEVKKEEM